MISLPWHLKKITNITYSVFLSPQMKGCCRDPTRDWALPEPPLPLPFPDPWPLTLRALSAAIPSWTCCVAGAWSCWWRLSRPSSCSPGSTCWLETWRVSTSRVKIYVHIRGKNSPKSSSARHFSLYGTIWESSLCNFPRDWVWKVKSWFIMKAWSCGFGPIESQESNRREQKTSIIRCFLQLSSISLRSDY